ncbi:hypothetical protein LguiA_034478 [Lonicera macranthoides]
MKSSNYVSLMKDPKRRRACFCGFFPTVLFCLVFFMGSAHITHDHKEELLKSGLEESIIEESIKEESMKEECTKTEIMKDSQIDPCQNVCRPPGSESLPKRIVANTSNLERRPLWGYPPKKGVNCSNSLLAISVGLKQKEIVDKMVRKFLISEFAIMLFHYDGIVDEWKDLEWSDRVIHVSAINQTKWWFAKRFLHPDIVAEYSYIFLWDEDIGVESFDPQRYLSIVKHEGLEISQPALDPEKSEVHHPITARTKRSKVHRRTYNAGYNGTRCNENSKGPPCTGWIEVMAPVFSRAAWRCVWYMIQNDLIHAWGLDMQLGYCAQGDRTTAIGVVDAEYIVHYGFPTLGEPENKTNAALDANIPEIKNLTSLETNASSILPLNCRVEVRRQSYREYRVFKRRWIRAVEEDKCWKNPYVDQEMMNNVPP